MKFNDNEQKDFEKPAAKTHPARLIGIYDIGVQPGNIYNGEQMDDKHQVIFTWELVGKDKQTDGRNFQVSEFLTVSLHKKGTLGKRLQALGAPIKSKSDDWWTIADDYNLAVLLGEPAMVEVVHTEKGKAKVQNVISPIEGMTIADATESLGYLDLDSDDYLDKYNSAPAWVRKMVEKSKTWAQM